MLGALLTLAVPSYAATTSEATIYGLGGTPDQFNPITSTTPGVPASISRVDVPGLGGALSSGSASAVSTPGFLSSTTLGASSGVPGWHADSTSINNSRATWTDTITINAAGHANEGGYITALLDFSGAVDNSYTPNNGIANIAFANEQLSFCSVITGTPSCRSYSTNPTGNQDINDVHLTDSPIADFEIKIGVTFGQGTDVSFSVDTFTRAGAGTYYGDPITMEASGFADLSVRWAGITGVFLNDNTRLDTGITASTSSGFDVINGFPAAAPVPEPETYAMMLAGLGLLGFAARRRKRKGA
jgi:hypothetical protein